MTLSKSLNLSGHPFPALRIALLVHFSYLLVFCFFPVPGIRFYKLRVRLITHESSENEHEMNLSPSLRTQVRNRNTSRTGFRHIKPLYSNPMGYSSSALQAKSFICSGFPIMAIMTIKQKVSLKSIQKFPSLPWPHSSD